MDADEIAVPIAGIRLTLDAVEAHCPRGTALPVEVLRERVAHVHRLQRACRFTEVGTELPGLIHDLHTAVATGTDHDELLDLAVHLHVHLTRLWLCHAGAPEDLIRRAAFLARNLAERRETDTALAMAGFGLADVLLHRGSFPVGRVVLDSITSLQTTAATAGLLGKLAAMRAEAALLSGRAQDVAAPTELATELAERFGTGGRADSLGFLYGPTHAGMCRLWLALEADEPDRGVAVAETLRPESLPFAMHQSHYWMTYGRALARLPARRDDAVWALRTAEDIYPAKVRHHAGVRESVAALVPGARRDAAGAELRGLAHRCGLPV